MPVAAVLRQHPEGERVEQVVGRVATTCQQVVGRGIRLRLSGDQVQDADLAGLAAVGVVHAAVNDVAARRRALHRVRES